MIQKDWVESFIENSKNKWITVSNHLWDHPEIKFEEFESSRYLMDGLKSEGFTIHKISLILKQLFMLNMAEANLLSPF